uniref:DUF4419 domain-containing protein n=1 Tax=Helicotheca tamesis TaxID=374047 RepID=A0A7S2N0V3_9STRA|mmetsp:Transcript_7200/g.9763  ORF Transcript_7200/g.9763 Transcript_7200/m.9763 type:complete len:422 (+) Transcript_7200:30-1295(+)
MLSGGVLCPHSSREPCREPIREFDNQSQPPPHKSSLSHITSNKNTLEKALAFRPNPYTMPCTFLVADVSSRTANPCSSFGQPLKLSTPHSMFGSDPTTHAWARQSDGDDKYRHAICHGRSQAEGGRSVYAHSVAPFIHALDAAFNHHLPLILSPDAILMVITQHFSEHINQNSEKYRHKLVSHTGKEKITVRNDSLVKHKVNNDWESVFDQFSNKLRDRLPPEIHSAVVADFSTTGPIEKACSEIVLMEAVQKYFDYGVRTSCGIPEITLEGNKQDWLLLSKKIEGLRGFDLDAWVDDLQIIVQQCVNCFDNEVDKQFWSSIYHYMDESGGPFVTGWVQVLYGMSSLKDAMGSFQRPFCGPSPDDFSIGRSKCPFVWKYYGEEIGCDFIGGFIGISLDPDTKAVKAEMGWEVVESTFEKQN